MPADSLKPQSKRPKQGFLYEHSLSIASIAIVTLWIVLYSVSKPSTHIGSFFGNAIADWTGVVVTVIATKYLYERNSAESRPPAEDSPQARARIHARSLAQHFPSGNRNRLDRSVYRHGCQQ
jgi:hypothetical protein